MPQLPTHADHRSGGEWLRTEATAAPGRWRRADPICVTCLTVVIAVANWCCRSADLLHLPL